MEAMSRRKWFGVMGGLSVAAGSLANLGFTGWRRAFALGRPRWRRVSARAEIQRRHLPNVTLVTHEGNRVRFYDDLIKDKKVIVSFIDTKVAESGTVTRNLRAVQRYFGDRVGRDMHMYSISLNPGDTPTVLKAWAERHDVAPGWQFLSGRQTDVEKVRRGVTSVEDSDPSLSIDKVRFGSEPEMRWAYCQALAEPRAIVHAVQLDFGADPADSDAAPIWNCELLQSIKA